MVFSKDFFFIAVSLDRLKNSLSEWVYRPMHRKHHCEAYRRYSKLHMFCLKCPSYVLMDGPDS